MSVRVPGAFSVPVESTCGASERCRPGKRTWRRVGRLRLVPNLEVLRAQYLNGTLCLDEREVARSLLIRILAY